MNTIEHFVGGKSFSGESKRTGKIFNPATGDQEAEVKLGTFSSLLGLPSEPSRDRL